MNSPKAVHWVQKEKDIFASSLSGTSMVRERMTSVILEYVPVLHNPDTLAENEKIEQDSGLEVGMLISMRWIKPLQRCTPGQLTAHLIVRFKTHKAANHAIRDRVVIVGKRTWARCMWREPKRCLKCQSLTANHLAAECNHPNMCRTCGKEHKTTECGESDSRKFWCANCKVVGHASWDHLCPRFIKVSRRLEKTDPEHMYRFIPNHGPWTWEQEPDGNLMGTGGWRNASSPWLQEDEGWGWGPGAKQAHPITHNPDLDRSRQCEAWPLMGENQGRRGPQAAGNNMPSQGGPIDQGWNCRPSQQHRIDELPQPMTTNTIPGHIPNTTP